MFTQDEKNKKTERTKKLLFSILEYCNANNLKFWIEEGYFNKFFVANEEIFQEKIGRSIYLEPVIVTKEIIESKLYNIFLGIKNNAEFNTSISPVFNWALRNPKEYNELYVHAFWSNEKDTMLSFAETWIINDYLNLSNVIEYSTPEYSNGFLDNKVIPYKLEKNWHHFLDTIPNEKLVNFWENHKKFEQFYNTLKIKKEKGLNIHSYLSTLTSRVCEFGISEDSQVKSSYMIMELIPEHLKYGYTKKFPFLRSLIDKIHRDSLFLQNDEEIVEKVVFPKIHIYDYFNNHKINASEYINLSIEALNQLKENQELKEFGLISIEHIENKNIVAYLTVSDRQKINKNLFKDLFIEVLDSYISHIDEIVTDINDKKIYNIKFINTLTNKIVSHWILERQLASKSDENLTTKRKIKM